MLLKHFAEGGEYQPRLYTSRIASGMILAVALVQFNSGLCAAEGEYNPRWTHFAVSSLTTVAYPRDNFVELGRISANRSGHGFDVRLLRGERWITLGREEAGALGLRASDVSNVLRQPRGANTMVFAVYSPQGSELRVRVSRMEKRNDGTIRSYLADFTPHHGQRWVAARLYLTPAEAANPHRAGQNPFARFRGALNDPMFRNVGWAAAQVAVGHAMRQYDAHAAIIAVIETRIDTRTEESGNIFRRRVETTTTAYARPRWFVALPEFAQPRGFSAAICVGANATDTACDAPEHIARSGVSIATWEGGNLPSTEETIAEWNDTRRGWSVLSIALGGVTGAAVLGLDPGSALLVANAVDPVNDNLAGEDVAFSNRTLPQAALTANHTSSIGHGSVVPRQPSSGEDAELRARLRSRTREPINAGFLGVRQMFVGTCAAGLSESECMSSGMQPGMLRRPENQTPMNPTRKLQASERQCRQLGYAGQELARCAALSRAPEVK